MIESIPGIPSILNNQIKHINFFFSDSIEFMTINFTDGDKKTYLRPNSIEGYRQLFSDMMVGRSRVRRDR